MPGYTFSGSAGSMTQFMTPMSGNRARAAKASKSGASGDLFDAEGLPTRLPGSPEEALQFQFAASNWARRKNESMLQNAQATMRYGLGMMNKFGPYSAATLMNPLLGQMSNNYMNMQYDQPDYSYFMRQGAGGGANLGPGINPGQAPTRWDYGDRAAASPQQAAAGPVAAPRQAAFAPQAAGPIYDEVLGGYFDTPDDMPNDPEYTGAGVGSMEAFYGYPNTQEYYELPENP